MILVKIELVSAVDPARNREIGRIKIVNDGTGNAKCCSYIAQVMRRGTEDKVLKTVTVHRYPRLAYSVWELVRRVLQDAFRGVKYEDSAEERSKENEEV